MHVYLDPGAGVQHDVLDGSLDVLRPGHQPGHLVVMANLLPLGPGGRLGVFGVPVGSSGEESKRCTTARPVFT